MHAPGRALWGYPASPGHGAEGPREERVCSWEDPSTGDPRRPLAPNRSLQPSPNQRHPLEATPVPPPKLAQGTPGVGWDQFSMSAGGPGTRGPGRRWRGCCGSESPSGTYTSGAGPGGSKEQPARRVGRSSGRRAWSASSSARATATICWKRSCACPARPPGALLSWACHRRFFPCLSGSRPAGGACGGCSLCGSGPFSHGSARRPGL